MEPSYGLLAGRVARAVACPALHWMVRARPAHSYSGLPGLTAVRKRMLDHRDGSRPARKRILEQPLP